MAEPKVINWCCGEHPFRLRIGEAEALDDLTKDGIGDFLYRLLMGRDRGSLAYSTVKQREVIECIRLGLIGGGMAADDARKLALRGWEEGDFGELVLICASVVGLCLSGKVHDQPEKPVRRKRKATSE